ncbi:uncharacterized protein K460DRAFT_354734 [Cucurbitaria berberidis CBS 394.84]|uniref:BTB domain-containing protein n=1 Tax=Cucurbitaria berberidis CBS 394.84 TaxID=1168544 RepID=A0A9P4L818_9PLEO|nr:uncharacterized protein K460DRAFT_354734 [Cucurbitaria berberidis CBS 394.84]KAF1844864.1 hypothetical protein K460DRAFT_354734 [Cucurbitaria berberidis CBS 394.84]
MLTSRKRKLAARGLEVEVEVIHKQGDVLLQLGKPEQPIRKILVSSTALSFASPVFAAMFDGRFLEGESLSQNSPPTVSLPEDDPESIVIICKVIHIQTSKFATKITATALANVVIACHKYDCLDTMHAWGLVWIAALLETPDDPGFEKTLLAAYLLDLPHEFHKVSRSLVLDRASPFSITTAAHGHDFLPTRLLERILSDFHDVQKRAIAAICKAVAVRDGIDYSGVNITLCERLVCDLGLQCIGLFIVNLQLGGLWPIGAHSITHIRTVVAQMDGLNPPAKLCPDPDCNCRSAGTMKEDLLSDIGLIHYSNSRGICLDCVQADAAGKTVENTGNCRLGNFPGYQIEEERLTVMSVKLSTIDVSRISANTFLLQLAHSLI